MPSAKGTIKTLGEVTIPSGIVLLIDFGLMDLWTHDKPPLIHEGVLSPEALESANKGADFQIDGPDAATAGKKFARQPHPLFLYDVPRHDVEDTKDQFSSLVKQHGLTATLSELSSRVCPRKRVDDALTHGNGAGEVFLHGIHAIAVGGVPEDRPLTVEGLTMGEGIFADHWHDISLVLEPGVTPALSKKIGHVAVDMARLMFCDVEAAGKWQHQDTIDGLADFVFWGKDAIRIAKKFGGKHIDGNIHGFTDKPIAELAELATQVQKHLALHHLVAAIDFRPHSDHWRMLKSVSEHDTESGVIDLNGSRCCGFMTSWGDGFFPVYLDLDNKGAPVRIRIELGTEETIRGMHMVNSLAPP